MSKLENIVLEFGNKVLDARSGRTNPTLGELVDEPVKEIEKYMQDTTIKRFVTTHSSKYSDFILGLRAGYIDSEGMICNAQYGAIDTFAVGMPVYSVDGEELGRLSIGLFEHLDYAQRTADGLEIPVYYWRVEGYNGERQDIKTYYQIKQPTLNSEQENKSDV